MRPESLNDVGVLPADINNATPCDSRQLARPEPIADCRPGDHIVYIGRKPSDTPTSFSDLGHMIFAGAAEANGNQMSLSDPERMISG